MFGFKTFFWGLWALNVARANSIEPECGDFLINNCHFDPGAILDALDLESEQECQFLCQITQDCQLFHYNKYQSYCYLLNQTLGSYMETCRIFGGPDHPDIEECFNQIKVDSCLQIRNAFCMPLGYHLENLQHINSYHVCQSACNLVDRCSFFIYDLDQLNCELIEGRDAQCDIMIGPPQPEVDYCLYGNTTTSSSTSTTITTTDPTTYSPTETTTDTTTETTTDTTTETTTDTTTETTTEATTDTTTETTTDTTTETTTDTTTETTTDTTTETTTDTTTETTTDTTTETTTDTTTETTTDTTTYTTTDTTTDTTTTEAPERNIIQVLVIDALNGKVLKEARLTSMNENGDTLEVQYTDNKGYANLGPYLADMVVTIKSEFYGFYDRVEVVDLGEESPGEDSVVRMIIAMARNLEHKEVLRLGFDYEKDNLQNVKLHAVQFDKKHHFICDTYKWHETCTDMEFSAFERQNHEFDTVTWYKGHHFVARRHKEEWTLIYVFYDLYWLTPLIDAVFTLHGDHEDEAMEQAFDLTNGINRHYWVLGCLKKGHKFKDFKLINEYTNSDPKASSKVYCH